jgi:hypothetical protein
MGIVEEKTPGSQSEPQSWPGCEPQSWPGRLRSQESNPNLSVFQAVT